LEGSKCIPFKAEQREFKIEDKKLRRILEHYRSIGVVLRTGQEKIKKEKESSAFSKRERLDKLYERLRREGYKGDPGKHPEAIAIKVEGMDSLNAAKYLKEEGFYDYALEYAERALAENPDSFEALLLRTDLLPPDREDERIAGYKRLLEMDPDNTYVLERLGMCLTYSNPKEALRYFQRALQIDPSLPLYFSIGECYERLGRYEEAIAAYMKCHERSGIEGETEALRRIRLIKSGNPFFKPIQTTPQKQLPSEQVPPGKSKEGIAPIPESEGEKGSGRHSVGNTWSKK